MKKIITLLMISLIALSVFAQGGTEKTKAAFIEHESERPETLDAYPVTGLAFDATTSVKANKKYQIAMIVKNNTNPFMNGVLEGFKKAGEDVGVEAILLSPAIADSNEEQARLVDDMIARGVDAICIHPVDSNGIVPALERAYEAGIPVLVQGTKANTDKIYGWYGTDYYEQAVQLAEYIAKTLNYTGNVIYIPGPPQAQNSQDRTNAFHTVFDKYPNLNIIAEQPGNFNRATSLDVVSNLLQKYSTKDFCAIIGGNDESAMGALMACQAAGVNTKFSEGGILISGFDCNKDASYAIQDGTITVSSNPDPVSLGYIGCVFLTQYLNDGKLFPKSFVAWPDFNNPEVDVVVDSSKIDDYIANKAWWK